MPTWRTSLGNKTHIDMYDKRMHRNLLSASNFPRSPVSSNANRFQISMCSRHLLHSPDFFKHHFLSFLKNKIWIWTQAQPCPARVGPKSGLSKMGYNLPSGEFKTPLKSFHHPFEFYFLKYPSPIYKRQTIFS